MAKHILIRTATEEDYRKMQNWCVGTFHRVSTLPETEQSSGEEPGGCRVRNDKGEDITTIAEKGKIT